MTFQTTDHIVIIGASAAGIAAAREIRKNSPDIAITLITEEAHLPYHRPSLTERIGNPAIEDRPTFRLEKESWFEEQHIRFIPGDQITTLDTTSKVVTAASGKQFSYDRLILAVGSNPFVPMQDALKLSNVYSVRTLDDARRLYDAAKQAKHAVVIGGGLLGLEAVQALLKLGLKVEVIELAERILPMQLDPDGSRIFGDIITKAGATLHLGAKIERIEGESSAEAVKLASGERIATDLIIFSIGVRPSINLAKNAGITVNRGITVNDRMETSAPGVYACGDCAEFGRNPALWMPALRMGAVAGTNAAGGSALFTLEEYPAMLSAFNTKVYSVGDIGRNSAENYRALEAIDVEKGIYKKLYFSNDTLVGGILIGDIKKSGALSKAIASKTTITDADLLLN